MKVKRNHMSTLAVRALALTPAVAVFPTTCRADAVFHIGGQVTLSRSIFLNGVPQYFYSYPDEFNLTGPSPLSNGLNYNDFIPNAVTLAASGFARADRFGLHASANASFNRVSPSNGNGRGIVRSATSATVTFDDFVISGSPGQMVTTSLNLHLSGRLSAIDGGETAAAGSGTANATVYVDHRQVGDGVIAAASRDTGLSGIGWLSTFNGLAVLQTASFTVPTNTPFTIQLQLGTTATAVVDEGLGGSSAGAADFGSTFSFATDRPVFDLPAGLTASSLEANIVDNRFVVPSPGSLAVLGLAGSFAARRRRATAPGEENHPVLCRGH